MRSRGGQKAGRVACGRRGARGLRTNSVLLALAALALLAGGALLFAQHSNTGTASLALQVDPADLLAIQGGTTVSLKIRLGTGPAYLWGDSLSDCNSPIGSAATISTSGIYTPLLSAVPFNQTSNDYVCVYSPSTSSLNTSVAWPHTGLSLAFSQQPTNTASGASISPAVTVQVKDSNGILVASSTASVTIGITSGTGTSGATLSGTLTQSAVNGVATFNNLSINKAGTGYTLAATSSGLTSATSDTFNITTGTAAQLAFTTQPTSSTGGVAFPAQPVVTLEDAGGNAVTGTAQNVTLAIQNNAGPGGVLSGTTTVAVNTSTGQATFSGLSINKAGTGYTLTATGSTVNTTAGVVVSSAFNITAGAAAQLAFTTQPGGGTGGTAWTTQPAVTVQDAGGNTVTSSSASITLAIGTNPSGGTLTCTSNPQSATSGVDTFAGCKIDKAGTGYTLTATSSGLTSATSNTFNITVGSAAQLAFTTQPGGGTGGTAWTTQPVVTVQDAGGNTVTTSSASITLAIGTNPGGGTLTCTTNPQNASSGVDTFAGCNINKAGNGYTLTATSSGLTSATSNTFNITAGTATKVVFTTQPGGGTGGTAWTTQPVVTVQDANGNTVTSSSASITLAIGTNPSGGTLACTTNPQNASSGVDTFAGCNINKAGNGYTLTATSSGLTSATSNTFNITVGSAAQLAFTTQPGGGTGGTAWTTQPVVTVQDAGGNTVTGSSASIKLAIGTNPGSGTLTCTTNPKNATSGVDTFAGCRINNAGNGYTLTATSSGLTSATSNTFNITGAATKVVFTMQPGGGTGGTAWTTQPVVTVEDANGNTVTGSSASITLAIGTNPGGGTLTCTTNPQNASYGVDTFAGCNINKAGTGYTLRATSTGLTSATSNTFNITVGSAAQLAITTQPGGGTGGTAWTTQPVVTVQDTGGNTVTTSSASITLAIGTNPGGGTLTCTTNPQNASSGVDTFAGCKIDKAGTGYTLTAASSGLTSATSSAFNITVGSAAQLAFTTQPGGGTAGTAWTTQPVVTVEDAGGNTVTSSSASITLAIGTNPGGGTLTCTTNPNSASSGVDTFAGCYINLGGTGYTLTATSSGLSTATSTAFNVQDFSISAAPSTVSESRGNSYTNIYQITLTLLGGFTGSVALSCSSVTPTGTNRVTCSEFSFPNSPISGSTTGRVNVTLSSTQTRTTYTITFTGTSGSLVRNANTVQLTVTN